MTKQHFIALADKIRAHQSYVNRTKFTQDQIDTIAGFCMDSNPRFNYSRWLDYIEGKCGSNGGAIKPPRAVATADWKRLISGADKMNALEKKPLAQQEHEESGCTDYLQHRAQDCPYLH